jgi:LuxR family maltose regulon positive regulatory protein
MSALHQAKVRRPATVEHYVRRPRLLELMDEVVTASLTLVVASAGAGKTSLVSGWAQESTTPIAWLSLDEADRDVVQFWSGVVAALETVEPGCGARALRMLRRSPSRAEAVDQLLADLENRSRSAAVVVIDDFHTVDHDEQVTASLARFVRHVPAWLHIVLLSRHDPPLPVDRLRSHGELGEIRMAELRFSPDEAVQLLNRLAPQLPDDGVEHAVQRADGWPASLQLAALAARSTRAQAAALAPAELDDHLVQHYVLHEVLADEATEVIDVLAAAAVVPRINASLAQVLTGRPDAGDLLRLASERGLFITRCGTKGWYDLHALVGGVLRADLESRAPDRLVELRTRAAQWFEDADEVPLALEQWLLAGRPLETLRLLASNHIQLYDTGREDTIVRTIAAIPNDVATGDLDAMVAFAWCHLLVDRHRFLQLVEQVTWWVGRSPATETTRARATLLRACAATFDGRWVESGTLARQGVVELGDAWWQDLLGRHGWHVIARDVALSERWDDAADDVRETGFVLSRDPDRPLALEGTRALGHALAGRPLDALRVSAGVRRAAAAVDMAALRSELSLAEALAHRELADRGRAVGELERVAEDAAEPMLYCRILATLELAQLRLDEGDLVAARESFSRARTLVETESFGCDGRGWLGRAGVVLALADGNIDEARHWVEQIGDPFWGAVSAARVHLATGDRAGARAAVDTAAPRCVRHEVVLALVMARAVTDRDEAQKWVATAIDIAAANGLLQTVASEGNEVAALVEHAAWRAPSEWLDRLRRVSAQPQCRSEPHRADLVEPLTDRERDVLRFLPGRLTVREIADELYVSVNTVKFHLRVIYRKLGVNSRAEAAEVARKMATIRR